MSSTTTKMPTYAPLIRPIPALRELTLDQHTLLDVWNHNAITTLRDNQPDYRETTTASADHRIFDEKMAQVINGYNQNCMLDINTPSLSREWVFSKKVVHNATWPMFAGIVTAYAILDFFGYCLAHWRDTSEIALENEILLAFERSARTHKLFDNARRMAVLLLTAFFSNDGHNAQRMTILISCISDSTWRNLAALAIGAEIEERVYRMVLIRICLSYGSHALDQQETNLLFDRNIDCDAVIQATRGAEFSRRAYSEIEKFVYDARLEILLREANRTKIPKLDDVAPGATNDEIEAMRISIEELQIIMKMLRRASRRLCKGEIFRTTLGLVNQQGGLGLGYLPTYAILPIVERALPDCIFTHRRGDRSGLLLEYEVVPIIETVVNYHRDLLEQREQQQIARSVQPRQVIDISGDDD